MPFEEPIKEYKIMKIIVYYCPHCGSELREKNIHGIKRLECTKFGCGYIYF